MLLTAADQLLLSAHLSPVQQRALIAWLADAGASPAPSADLCERASRLFAQASALALTE